MKSARDIAARAVCMGVIEFRARFEGARLADAASAPAEATEMIAGVTAWLNDAGLSSSLLAQERAILGLEPNTWDRKILEALSGAMLPESIGALFAGMNLIGAIPPYDRMFDAESLLRTLPFLSDSPFVKSPGMPPRDEWEAMATGVGRADEAAIAAAEGIAGLWWWRAVSESLVRAGKMPRAQLAGILRDGEARSRKLEIPFGDGDFVVFGKPYGALTPPEQRAVSAVTEARIRGLRWMLDGDVTWDAVSMDS